MVAITNPAILLAALLLVCGLPASLGQYGDRDAHPCSEVAIHGVCGGHYNAAKVAAGECNDGDTTQDYVFNEVSPYFPALLLSHLPSDTLNMSRAPPHWYPLPLNCCPSMQRLEMTSIVVTVVVVVVVTVGASGSHGN